MDYPFAYQHLNQELSVGRNDSQVFDGQFSSRALFEARRAEKSPTVTMLFPQGLDDDELLHFTNIAITALEVTLPNHQSV